MSIRHFVPPAFIAVVGGLTLGAGVVPYAGRAAVSIMAIYTCVVLSVAAANAVKRGRRARVAGRCLAARRDPEPGAGPQVGGRGALPNDLPDSWLRRAGLAPPGVGLVHRRHAP